MEKFYRVDKNHKLNEVYNSYKDMSHRVNEAFKEFCQEIGMEVSAYYQYTDRLCVIPTENDRKKFREHFKAHDLGNFKKTSEFSKAWVKKCADLNLKTPERPQIRRYFECFARCSSIIEFADGVIYAKFESNGDFISPEGFAEILGSEFYKVIESQKE